MPHDVFISYPHQDKAIADAACAKLESEGIRCWIAPRDIAPSAEWAASIVEAIDGCRVMVLIFSAHTNQSRQVGREVQQAFDGEKPVVPFRIENVAPEKSMRYYMGSVHWLDALTPPIEQHLQKLVMAVQALVRARAFEEGGPRDQTLRDDGASHLAEGERRRVEQEGKQQKDAAARRAEEERQVFEANARKAEEERLTRQAEAAQRKEQDDAFATAKGTDTLREVEAFLFSYPESPHAEEARQLRERLKGRDDAFDKAIASDDPTVLNAFLKTYPRGRQADKIRQRRRHLKPQLGSHLSLSRLLIGIGAIIGIAFLFFPQTHFACSSQSVQGKLRAIAPSLPSAGVFVPFINEPRVTAGLYCESHVFNGSVQEGPGHYFRYFVYGLPGFYFVYILKQE